jgi:hypothetical protein
MKFYSFSRTITVPPIQQNTLHTIVVRRCKGINAYELVHFLRCHSASLRRLYFNESLVVGGTIHTLDSIGNLIPDLECLYIHDVNPCYSSNIVLNLPLSMRELSITFGTTILKAQQCLQFMEKHTREPPISLREFVVAMTRRGPEEAQLWNETMCQVKVLAEKSKVGFFCRVRGEKLVATENILSMLGGVTGSGSGPTRRRDPDWT